MLLLNHAHYRNLDADMTNHDIYDRNYRNWHSSNDAGKSDTANV